MSSIVNFDRDLEYLRLNQDFIYLSNEHPWTQPYYVKSDGVIYEQDASLYFYIDSSFTFSTVGYCRGIGLHIINPDITNGSPYRIQGYAFEETGLYQIYLMYGIGPSSFDLTNPGPGDPIVTSVPLLVGTSLIQFDKTVYLPPFEFFYPGGGYENRPLTFYIMYRRTTTAPTPSVVSCRLSVQRLGVKPPAYITANR